jgi:hypothetical protein
MDDTQVGATRATWDIITGSRYVRDLLNRSIFVFLVSTHFLPNPKPKLGGACGKVTDELPVSFFSVGRLYVISLYFDADCDVFLLVLIT